MKIRRFTAHSIEAAMRMARHALGPEAVILETRGAISSPGGVGVTVVAAVDRSHPV
ncbi:MAG: flagellar biosynthesis protein FlhF, partial [Candidatus Eisenbacteria bacterium]|nr:flagellar biosynthesis protein FlhF [Candidatus Eisenbacteria bacterium]